MLSGEELADFRGIRHYSSKMMRDFHLMSKLKRLVKLSTSWLLLVFLTISLNSCTVDQLSSQPETLQGSLLIILPLNDESNSLISSGLQDFKRLNPKVNIVIEYHSKDQLLQRFVKEAQKGLGATAIIDLSNKIIDLANLGSIQPIAEESIDLSRYLTTTLTQVRYRGKIYGIPLGSKTRILCYNQAKLQMSQDPILSQPPTKLDGLIERAIKGYSVGMVSSFEDTFWGIGSFGGSFLDTKGNIKPQLEGWAKWLEWLKNASAQPNFFLVQESRDILHDAFVQGKLTYYVCDSNEIPDLKNALHNDFKVALLPGASFPAAPLLYTKVIMFNRSASSKEMRIALALAKYLTNSEQQIYAIMQSQSYIPSNRNISLDMRFLPIQSVLLEQAKTVIAIPLDQLEQILAISEQAEFLYQQAIAGQISSTEAAQQLTIFTRLQISQQPKL